MDRSDHPKNQHYVPQFLLANFCIQGGKRVFCYDKQQDRVFQTNVRNIASEKLFYDMVEGRPELSLERPLAELESVCSRIINGHILSKRTLRGLSQEDLGWLGLFVAIQMLRTTHIRESIRHMDDQLAKELS